MTSSVVAKAPKKTTKRSQQVRAEIEDGCHNTSKENGQEVSNQKELEMKSGVRSSKKTKRNRKKEE
jgi:hypothetical protein